MRNEMHNSLSHCPPDASHSWEANSMDYMHFPDEGHIYFNIAWRQVEKYIMKGT
jgi:hypothetical protein